MPNPATGERQTENAQERDAAQRFKANCEIVQAGHAHRRTVQEMCEAGQRELPDNVLVNMKLEPEARVSLEVLNGYARIGRS